MKNYLISLSNLLLSTLLVVSCLTAGASAQLTDAQAQLVSSDTENSTGGKAPIRYWEYDVMDRINKERKENSLQPLTWNNQAAEVARRHSKDMGWYNYFNHRGLDGNMINDRADALGLDWQMIGENIAMMRGFDDPVEHAVTGWMQSPGHCKNILNPRWKETGIGLFITYEGTYYFTQVFLLKK